MGSSTHRATMAPEPWSTSVFGGGCWYLRCRYMQVSSGTGTWVSGDHHSVQDLGWRQMHQWQDNSAVVP